MAARKATTEGHPFTSDDTMETPSKTEPIVDKIRRGEVSVFVAVAEEMPEVFRTHVVPKLGLH